MQNLVVVKQLDAHCDVDHRRCAGGHTRESVPQKPLGPLARDDERIEYAQERVGNPERHHDYGRDRAGRDHSDDGLAPAGVRTQFIGHNLADSGPDAFRARPLVTAFDIRIARVDCLATRPSRKRRSGNSPEMGGQFEREPESAWPNAPSLKSAAHPAGPAMISRSSFHPESRRNRCFRLRLEICGPAWTSGKHPRACQLECSANPSPGNLRPPTRCVHRSA